ncbi:MAG: PEGA domain-containing protein [Ignavibacteriales bacterium]|nr:PEGA domain-containing protein [Ignavibacteriales bacterium]
MTIRRRAAFSAFFISIPLSLLAQVDPARARPVLSIRSIPEGAEVFLDSTRMGVTPLALDTISPGIVRLSLLYPDFETWETTLTIEAGMSLTVNPKLTPKHGFLVVRTSFPDAEILVDSNLVGSGDLEKTKLPHGWHNVEVRHPDIKLATSKVHLEPGQIVQLSARFNHFTTTPTLYSVVVPGMTQIADGSLTEGLLMVGSATLAGLLYLQWNMAYENRYLDYVAKEAEYLSATNELDATRLGREYRDAYKAAEQVLSNRNAARAGALVVYAVSLIEALLFHSTTSSLDVVSRNYEPTFSLRFPFGFPTVTMVIVLN